MIPVIFVFMKLSDYRNRVPNITSWYLWKNWLNNAEINSAVADIAKAVGYGVDSSEANITKDDDRQKTESRRIDIKTGIYIN